MLYMYQAFSLFFFSYLKLFKLLNAKYFRFGRDHFGPPLHLINLCVTVAVFYQNFVFIFLYFLLEKFSFFSIFNVMTNMLTEMNHVLFRKYSFRVSVCFVF